MLVSASNTAANRLGAPVVTELQVIPVASLVRQRRPFCNARTPP